MISFTDAMKVQDVSHTVLRGLCTRYGAKTFKVGTKRYFTEAEFAKIPPAEQRRGYHDRGGSEFWRKRNSRYLISPKKENCYGDA